MGEGTVHRPVPHSIFAMATKLLLCLLLTAVSLASTSAQDAPDPCIRKDTNCYQEGNGQEIGHTTWLPDVTVCENACRDTPGCAWFTYSIWEHSTPATSSRDVQTRRKMNTPSRAKYRNVRHRKTNICK